MILAQLACAPRSSAPTQTRRPIVYFRLWYQFGMSSIRLALQFSLNIFLNVSVLHCHQSNAEVGSNIAEQIDRLVRRPNLVPILSQNIVRICTSFYQPPASPLWE